MDNYDDVGIKWGKVWLAVVLFISIVLGASFMLQGGDWFIYKIWAPRQEAARYEVFKESKAHVEGEVQELDKFRLEYLKATDPGVKNALRSTILRHAVTLDADKLPADLRDFIQQLKNEEGK